MRVFGAVLFLFSCFFQLVYCQSEFGSLSYEEKNFRSFEKDTTAAAVYLYERGNNFFDVRNQRIYLITQYHAKIKVLKKDGFENLDIQIPFYHNENSAEKVLDIKAMTHNGKTQTYLKSVNIFTVDDDENWSHKAFTFPDVQIGSILEYSYEVQSPFHFNLSGWDFQSEIPKVYTEYNARIPGNWKYNRTLIGEFPLDVNEADVRKDCFYIVGYGVADCEILKYSMSNVPAFEDDEAFMLAARNYRSKLEFELAEYHSLKGYTEKFTKTWKDVDKEFKNDRDLGRQLRKKNFFEDKVPADLFDAAGTLQSAQTIYEFAKKHYNWNGEYGIWKNNRIKKAFEERKGNASEINISLINLLNEAGFEAKMMLIATRNRGLPNKSHPVMTDFNYIVAKVDIEGQTYLLDATEKEMPFGMLPFRCLNYYGRVMDFDNESYWFDVIPTKSNKKQIRAQMELDLEEAVATGKFNSTRKGYESVSERQKLKSYSEEEYLDNLASKVSSDFYINSHKILEERSNDKMLVQQFDFEIENIFQDGTIYIDPNIIKFFTKNPFLAEERHYPIDFGYQRDYAFNLNLKVPEGYVVKSMPKNRAIALPGKTGLLQFQCQNNAGSVFVLFSLKLKATHFKSESYSAIKEFFKQAVEAQNNSFIVLEKA